MVSFFLQLISIPLQKLSVDTLGRIMRAKFMLL
jgi:hypothetical protein